MPDETPPPVELSMAYSQKFWDAGNAVVTIAFGLDFAVFAIFLSSEEARLLIREPKYYWTLIAISAVGNIALYILLSRLRFHEVRIIKSLTNNSDFIDSINSAFDLRIGIWAARIILFLTVITVIYCTKESPKATSISVTISIP
jgi:hypothetical protein